MSLDLYLYSKPGDWCVCSCGHEHQSKGARQLFSTNITHNLRPMFIEAGIGNILWYGDGKIAANVLSTLRAGLAMMLADPDRFKKFDAPNGWGLYVHAVPWLEEVIAGFERYPHGEIRCSR